eukprot:CAMPEP_0194277016 /NCGR_PEP_ID=MMETSP0169-20130528/9443_1 /TAXON_ID=218684 /ORGANISM="Corethron pennatum, Strain L29A3" /LENGTH=65 /DNA_ID=CAMNT_0039020865 /DNA_START=71 /DNA_END=268 /DNA_ORIENTATION=-
MEKLAYTDKSNTMTFRKNEDSAIDPLNIAGAETLLETEPIQKTVADSLVMHQDGSIGENDDNQGG